MLSTLSLRKFPQRSLWNCSNVRVTVDGPLSSFQGRSSSASSFHASLLQAIDGVMSLALCPQVEYQTPQHFRSEKQATCEGCFSRPSICVISFTPACPGQYTNTGFGGMMSTINWHIPVWASHSTHGHDRSKTGWQWAALAGRVSFMWILFNSAFIRTLTDLVRGNSVVIFAVVMPAGIFMFIYNWLFTPICIVIKNLFVVLWLAWMCGECAWDHKTFLVQIYWHLVIKPHCIVRNISKYPYLQPEIHFISDYTTLRPSAHPSIKHTSTIRLRVDGVFVLMFCCCCFLYIAWFHFYLKGSNKERAARLWISVKITVYAMLVSAVSINTLRNITPALHVTLHCQYTS